MRAPGLPAALCAAGKARPRAPRMRGARSPESGPVPPRFPDVRRRGTQWERRERFSSVSSGLVTDTSAASAPLSASPPLVRGPQVQNAGSGVLHAAAPLRALPCACSQPV